VNHHLILRKIGHLTGTDAKRIDANLQAVLLST
jgi:hypothetical protein